MKIIQFINTLSVSDGGPSRNSFELNISLNLIAETDAQLVWFRGRKKDSVADSYGGQAGLIPLFAPESIWNQSLLSRSRFALLKRIFTADIWIVHGYYLWWVPLVATIARLLKKPLVITPHGTLTTHQQSHSRNRKWVWDETIGRFIARTVSALVTGSESEASELSGKFPHVQTFVGGVGTTMPAALNNKDHWQTPLRLMTMSRIAPKKRLDICISTIKYLALQDISATLDVYGDGDAQLLSQLKELAEQEGVAKHVHFHGQVAGFEKTLAFTSSDLFLLPSDDENFGIGVAEALAHGVPVIVSSKVSAAFNLPNAVGRVIVDPDPETMCTTIQGILNSGIPASEWHAAAGVFAKSTYSWNDAAEAWTKALQRILTGQRDKA